VLRLDQSDAQKSRLRRATEGGVEVAISLDRGVRLQDGDVLLWDPSGRAAIVARIDLSEVLEIDLAALPGEPVEVAMARCVELGHALGNQHWPAIVKGLSVYVPVIAARSVMASVMKTHAFEGVTYAFVAGQEVIPYLAPHEARRLFGATAEHSHSDVGEVPA
jgi:urease accessory protein